MSPFLRRLPLLALVAFGRPLHAEGEIKDVACCAAAQKRIMQSLKEWIEDAGRVAERLEKSADKQDRELAKRLRRAVRYANDSDILPLFQKQVGKLEVKQDPFVTLRVHSRVRSLWRSSEKLQEAAGRFVEVVESEELGRLHELSLATDARIAQFDRIPRGDSPEAIASLLADLAREERLPAPVIDRMKRLLRESLDAQEQLPGQLLFGDWSGVARGVDRIVSNVDRAKTELQNLQRQVRDEMRGRRLVAEPSWRDRLARRQREVSAAFAELARKLAEGKLYLVDEDRRQSLLRGAVHISDLQTELYCDLEGLIAYLKSAGATEKSLQPLLDTRKALRATIGPPLDPDLSDAGQRRVRELADALPKALAQVKVPISSGATRHPLLDRLRHLEQGQQNEADVLRRSWEEVAGRLRDVPTPKR